MAENNGAQCDCSEEYGPCEAHGVTLAQREGASLRTGDELGLVYIGDALSIDPSALSAYGQETYKEAAAALAESSWIDDADLAEALTDLTHQVEAYISDTDLQTFWEDGYRIVRITGGPLLED